MENLHHFRVQQHPATQGQSTHAVNKSAPTNADPTARSPLQTAFLRHAEVERGLAPGTIEAYAEDLQRFADWGAAQSPMVEWSQVRAEHVRAFVAQAHRQGLSGKSLARKLSALRSFFDWLIRERVLGANPARGIRAPKSPRKLPSVLDADQLDALLDFPEGDPLAVRDRAMFELFYSSALRLSELVNLRWHDYDAVEGLVRVLGKGQRTRVVPVGSVAAKALATWQSDQAPSSPAQPMFTARGERAISVRNVQARLKTWAQRQGVWQRVHPHMLRHSCASHVLESSGNLRAVQELLGHADIATTQIYTHLDFQHLARVYDAAHPRARKT